MYFKFTKYKLFFQKYGNSDKTILILPGWGNTRDTFKYLINYFKEFYTIYILDYPGFGNSPEINGELNIYDYSYIIKSFMDKNSIKKPIIISHSFGGRISAILVGKYKIDVNKLILIDVAGIKRIKPSIILKQIIYKLLKKISFFLPCRLKDKYREYLLYKFGSSDYKDLSLNMRKTFKNIISEDLKKHYKNINTDTLILWGDNDIDTPVKDAFLLNKIIKKSDLVIFKNSSHYSYLQNIYRTNIIIKYFIEKED